MTENHPQKLRLDFGNLPLVEAALRISLESSVKLRFATIDSIKSTLSSEFPDRSEPDQIEVPPGITASMPFGPGQLLGARFMGNPNGLAISIQPQVIVVRWQRRDEPDAADYPRYPALRDAASKAVGAFKTACGTEFPAAHVVNMSYVNMPQISHSEPVVQNYFSDRAQIDLVSDAQTVHKIEASWRDSYDVDLRFSLEQVTAEFQGERVEAHRLTTVAGTRLSTSSDAEACMDRVHDSLQWLFTNLLSERAKSEWKLQEVRGG